MTQVPSAVLGLSSLQLAQSSAAKIIFYACCFHSPFLKTLKWLPVSSWVIFKSLPIGFRTFSQAIPFYVTFNLSPPCFLCGCQNPLPHTTFVTLSLQACLLQPIRKNFLDYAHWLQPSFTLCWSLSLPVHLSCLLVPNEQIMGFVQRHSRSFGDVQGLFLHILLRWPKRGQHCKNQEVLFLFSSLCQGHLATPNR